MILWSVHISQGEFSVTIFYCIDGVCIELVSISPIMDNSCCSLTMSFLLGFELILGKRSRMW